LGNSGSTSIKAQVFSAAGAKVGSEFLVNSQTIGDQGTPSVASLSGGGFVVTWYDTSGTLGNTSEYSIKAQVFSAAGAKQGAEFLVNTQTLAGQYNPVVTGLAGGGFVVTWNDNSGLGGDSSEAGIKAQLFSASGAKQGGEFLVNTNTMNSQFAPVVTSLKGGGFVVAWFDYSGTLGDSSGTSIKAQVFTAAGAKHGGEFLVNTDKVNDQNNPAISSLADGGFVVTWSDYGAAQGTSSDTSLKAQVFTADGAKQGGEFLVSTQPTGDKATHAILGLSNGGFLATWFDTSGTLGDNDGSAIHGQLFGPVTHPSVVTGTTGNDKLTGTTAADELQGLAGNDTLDGRAGNDTMIGGAGNDTYTVDSSGDKVVELVSAGTDTVRTKLANYSLSANVENLTFSDSRAHTGIGNDLANRITGSLGNDMLDGRGGADILIGGAGNDSYVVDVKGDKVVEAADGGSDTVNASVTFTLGANVENLTLTGTAAIAGTGNATGNVITGNAAANVLRGLDGNDTLSGFDGNDKLFGGNGDDKLFGGAGGDSLSGGFGIDVMTGGAGADRFVFDTAPDPKQNRDSINDFVSGTDKLVFSKSVFGGFATIGTLSVDEFWSGPNVYSVHDSSDRLMYNTTTGDLTYDADGTGKGQPVVVAMLAGHPDLVFSDILIVA
jgi:Ca2+-binding RTX toxin-like protein